MSLMFYRNFHYCNAGCDSKDVLNFRFCQTNGLFIKVFFEVSISQNHPGLSQYHPHQTDDWRQYAAKFQQLHPAHQGPPTCGAHLVPR
jgi:hypothetical protein